MQDFQIPKLILLIIDYVSLSLPSLSLHIFIIAFIAVRVL